MSNRLKKWDWAFSILEKRLIAVLLWGIFLVFQINYLVILNTSVGSDSLQGFIETPLKNSLINLQTSLMSIAAIFIGIFMTVFTLLGSIRADSIFAFLNEKNFKRLIIYIRNAFIASFLFLIQVLSLDLYYGNFEEVNTFWIIINLILILYVFASALRLGVILYVAFNKDLKDLPEKIKRHRAERQRLLDLQNRIETFLEEEEEKIRKRKAEEMSELIKEQEKRK